MTDKPSDFGGLFVARRIIVTGANGAGKTRFAMALARARGLPLHHNDALAVSRDWRYRPRAELDRLRAQVAATDDWIIEGGPSLTRAGPIAARAELIVWLDVPRLRRCWRILTRTIRYHRRTRPELPAGNVEAFNARSLRFLRKAWHTDAEVRRHLTQVSAVRPTLRLHGWNEADLWR